MIYSRGKGTSIYRNSGFGNFGFLIGLFLIPFQVFWVAIKTIIAELKKRKQKF